MTARPILPEIAGPVPPRNDQRLARGRRRRSRTAVSSGEEPSGNNLKRTNRERDGSVGTTPLPISA